MENRDCILLNAIYKNVRMATWAIDNISPAIENEALKELVKKQNSVYEQITHKCKNYAKKQHIDLKDISFCLKSMSCMSIKCGTLFNKKTSHIAEKLINGTTMGITDIIKKTSESGCENEDLRNLSNDLKRNEEVFVEGLKEFLMR